MKKTNNSSTSGNKDSNLSNIQPKKAHTNSESPGFKPAAVWESPSFEEFGLCMEVTAYVHQLD